MSICRDGAFTDGVDFVFPGGTTIAGGGHVIVAQDPAAMLALHGAVALGPYSGSLGKEGERVALRDAGGVLIDEVTYKDEFPWPVGALGSALSMELINPALDNDLGGSWRVAAPRPTPGGANSVSAANAAPQARQVKHSPRQPSAGQAALVTVKVTDPDGVMGVSLLCQAVAPGAYIPAFAPHPLPPPAAQCTLPQRCVQDYDVNFLASNNMEAGNLYKLKSNQTDGKDVQRYQAKDSVDDASDFANIIFNLAPDKDETWLRGHVDWDNTTLQAAPSAAPGLHATVIYPGWLDRPAEPMSNVPHSSKIMKPTIHALAILLMGLASAAADHDPGGMDLTLPSSQ